MSELTSQLVARREAILLGEFGALLHMFGKASSEFLVANSVEGDATDSHQSLKHLPALSPLLQDPKLTDRLSFAVGSVRQTLSGNFADFITKYKGTGPDSHLLKLFNTCHRMTSADEKGVVRRKQSIRNIRITTPFGRPVKTISPNEIDETRKTMDQQLAQAMSSFLDARLAVEDFRRQALNILEPGMSVALGETREPANDVTLWDQSYGVACLYKSCLAALAVGKDPCPRKNSGWDYDNMRWRLLGIGWNGLSFVQRGRKAADILRRQEILDEIREGLQGLLEEAYPIGNLFYVDINGVVFTFPGIDQQTTLDLMGDLGPKVVQLVRDRSDSDLWPFLTLSRPRRTLTAIAREIDVRDQLASIPCIAPILSVESDQPAGGQRQEVLLTAGPSLNVPGAGEDVCPVCRFRSKSIDDETCAVCEMRRSGRQSEWRKNPKGETIWVDEIADANNRVSLLTLRFDLSRWLNGEWLTTILSQTFDEWAKGERLYPTPGKVKKTLAELVTKGEIELPESVSALESARSFARWTVKHPDRTECKPVLESFLEVRGGEISSPRAALDEIEDNYGSLSAESVLSHFFTQNASPGRLRRIWEATEDFLGCFVNGLRDDVFADCPQRLSFRTSTAGAGVSGGQTYRVKVPGLEGGPVVVLSLSQQDFLTVDSLGKFKFRRGSTLLQGAGGVANALRANGIQSWLDEATGQTVAGVASIEDVRDATSYLPFAVLARSPMFCQVLLPASSVPALLESLLKLEEEHFAVVRGKLPLHIGVLIAKRKLPLYALLEAGQQILSHSAFRDGWLQRPWWQGVSGSVFYQQYPTEPSGPGGHRVNALSDAGGEQQLWLTPGYFDFDLLGATTDRHRLQYQAASSIVRRSVAYGPICPRPMPLHRLSELLELWKLLTGLPPTQRHHVEAALGSKLEQWGAVGEQLDEVFAAFAKAVLCDAFGDRWTKGLEPKDRDLLLRSARDGLLLDCLQFFEHVVKGELSHE